MQRVACENLPESCNLPPETPLLPQILLQIDPSLRARGQRMNCSYDLRVILYTEQSNRSLSFPISFPRTKFEEQRATPGGKLDVTSHQLPPSILQPSALRP